MAAVQLKGFIVKIMRNLKQKETALTVKAVYTVGALSIASIMGCMFISQANAGGPTVEGVCVTATLLSDPSVVTQQGYCGVNSPGDGDEVIPPEVTPSPTQPPIPEITSPPEIIQPPEMDFASLTLRELKVPGTTTAKYSWSSNDGKMIIATRLSSKNIYISNDYGETWKTKILSIEPSDVSVSKNGQTIIASNPAKMEVSTDGGDSWNARILPSQPSSIALSGDGSTIAYSEPSNSDKIFVSDDLGQTWSVKRTKKMDYQFDISLSNDGNVISVGSYSAFFSISKDGGDTWKVSYPSLGQGGAGAIAMSDDTQIMLGIQDSHGGVSKNGGESWKSTGIGGTAEGSTVAISVSSDGNTLIHVTSKNIYGSTDGGETWSKSPIPAPLKMLKTSSSLQFPIFNNADKFYIGEFGAK